MVAAGLTAGAFIAPTAMAWPLQNLVNLAIILGVSRVLQYPRLLTVIVALAGLAVYDTVAVFGADGGEGGMSVMETVARSRLGAIWQPGLLQVDLRGRVTDALGLGDIIFPSMLTGWAMRFDANNSMNTLPDSGDELGLYQSTLLGFAGGCILCELNQQGGGLPALLFVVPSMLAAFGSVVLGAARSKNNENIIRDLFS
jgi:presenilin-like A22 family membrane protease